MSARDVFFVQSPSEEISTYFPNSNVTAQIAGLKESGFTAEELRGIYRENALKILPALARS